MPESQNSLNEILDELHEALEASDDIGEESRERLRSAAREIRRTIGEGDGSKGETPQSLLDRLNESIEEFEGRHPNLTAIVGRIADALSDMGI